MEAYLQHLNLESTSAQQIYKRQYTLRAFKLSSVNNFCEVFIEPVLPFLEQKGKLPWENM